jgi:hypothetical protein
MRPARAGGGKLPGFGGGDRNPALLEDGETVVSKEASRKPYMVDAFRAAGVPGYKGGGIAGMVPTAARAESGFAKAVETNLLNTEFAHLKASVAAAARAKAAAAAASSASIPGGGAAAAGTSAAAAQSWMKGHLNLWGWGQDQFSPLLALWNHESGWRWDAQNPSSPAYGIPQADPGSKMAAAGSDWRTNPETQMRWGGSYIKGSYGNPAHAWAFEMSHTPNWYANGGATSSGWATVGEHGRELVKIPGGATVYPNGGASQMVAGGAPGPTLVQLEIGSTGSTTFDAMMLEWVRNNVRIKGGGDVQKAFGRT